MYRKEIVYDRDTRDYAMYLDGELVGFGRTYHEAEVTLDQTVFELLNSGHFNTATELDGGCDDPPGPNPEDENEGDDDSPEWRSPAPPILMPEGDWIDVEGMRVRAPTNAPCVGRPCPTCGDEGDCPDCGTYTQPLLVDVHTVLSQCLNNAPAKAMVPELRRLLARVESELSAERVPSPRRPSTSMLSKIRQGF